MLINEGDLIYLTEDINKKLKKFLIGVVLKVNSINRGYMVSFRLSAKENKIYNLYPTSFCKIRRKSKIKVVSLNSALYIS